MDDMTIVTILTLNTERERKRIRETDERIRLTKERTIGEDKRNGQREKF